MVVANTRAAPGVQVAPRRTSRDLFGCEIRMTSPTSIKSPAGSTTTKVVVATTVALSFITFWQAAAVVLNDMASTMYYIGGITEQAIGKPAPWVVMAVM